MQLVDIYITYTLVKRLSTPFKETPAFKLGIIDAEGNVLTPLSKLKTQQEKDAWTYLDILINNIKRMLVKIPGAQSKLFVYAAAIFLLQEPMTKLQSVASKPSSKLKESIESKLDTARYLIEDAPENAAGNGAVAGLGVGAQGEPGFFAGHAVYHVDSDTFHKARFGKKKHSRYKTIVGENEVGSKIREYGRKNRGKAIIVSDPHTGAMTFLRRQGKYQA